MARPVEEEVTMGWSTRRDVCDRRSEVSSGVYERLEC